MKRSQDDLRGRLILFVGRNDLIFSVASAIITLSAKRERTNVNFQRVARFDFHLTKQTRNPVGFHQFSAVRNSLLGEEMQEQTVHFLSIKSDINNYIASFFQTARTIYKVIKHDAHAGV